MVLPFLQLLAAVAAPQRASVVIHVIIKAGGAVKAPAADRAGVFRVVKFVLVAEHGLHIFFVASSHWPTSPDLIGQVV